MKTRLSAIRTLLKKNHLDGALLSKNATIQYLTGYYGFSSIERDAFLLITQKTCYLFTSALYATEVKKQTSGIEIKERTSKISFTQQFSTIILEENLKTIGIEDEDLTVAEYQEISSNSSIELFPVSLHNLRVIKSLEEKESIQKACTIGDLAYQELQKHIKPGISESELALELELIIRKSGANLSFPTIVAFGQNSAIPHHHSDDTPLKKDDVILLDFGVLYQNYCSDMTRTSFICTPTNQQKKAYQTVLQAQQEAVDLIKSQLLAFPTNKNPIQAAAIDKVARDYITSQNYPSLPHSLGHGIGLQVHEAPSLSPLSKEKLSEGMVFSIEPGIYLDGQFGIRIEDLYTIENNKLIQLTHSSNSLELL